MAIPSDILNIIENKIGDQDAKVMEPLLGVLWNARTDKALIDPDLQTQYTLRDAIEVLQGQTWQLIETRHGDEIVKLDDKINNLNTLYENATEEIKRIEARASANRAPATGELLTQAPRKPGPMVPIPRGPYPNPNDPGYRGDPLRRTIPPDTPQF